MLNLPSKDTDPVFLVLSTCLTFCQSAAASKPGFQAFLKHEAKQDVVLACCALSDDVLYRKVVGHAAMKQRFASCIGPDMGDVGVRVLEDQETVLFSIPLFPDRMMARIGATATFIAKGSFLHDQSDIIQIGCML